MTTLSVLQRRGDTVEGTHPVSAVLVSDGQIVERIGDPVVTTWRSGTKPFQLQGSLSLLPATARAALAPRHLAIGAASHAGEPAHIQAVREILTQFGLGPEDLYCGTHWPLHVASGRQLLREGREPMVLHNNCSGKHSFMAAATRVQGWEADYRDPAHPLQQHIHAVVQARTGGAVQGVVTDGCGVPCFVLEIAGMARAYAALAEAMSRDDTLDDTALDASDHLLGRVGWAMCRHPFFASGTGRIDGRVMEYATELVVAKVGAAALLCVALPEERAGIVLKVHSADDPARAVALHAVLERWFPGLLPAEAVAEEVQVLSCVGAEVGRRVAIWDR